MLGYVTNGLLILNVSPPNDKNNNKKYHTFSQEISGKNFEVQKTQFCLSLLLKSRYHCQNTLKEVVDTEVR